MADKLAAMEALAEAEAARQVMDLRRREAETAKQDMDLQRWEAEARCARLEEEGEGELAQMRAQVEVTKNAALFLVGVCFGGAGPRVVADV